MKYEDVFERIKKQTGLKSQTGIANVLGIQPASVSGSKKRGLFPIEWAFRIAQKFGLSTDWILTGEGPEIRIEGTYQKASPLNNPFDMVQLAKARLNAGGGSVVLSEEFKESYAFRKEWISRIATNKRNLFLIAIEGDSMEPTILDGDIVMIDKGRNEIRTGKIYAIGVSDTIMIKRLELLPNSQVKIISDNQTYSPYIIDGKELRIIGQVVWFARELITK